MNLFSRAGIFACLLLFNTAALYAQEFLPSHYPDRVTLTWSADPTTTQTVTWRTDATVDIAKAQLKKEDASPDMEAGVQEFASTTRSLVTKEGREDRYHYATFTGLQPASVYVYRVGDGEHWSEWYQFRTANAIDRNSTFSFIYLGDGQNDLKSRWSRTIRQAFRQQPDARFVIHDLINRAKYRLRVGRMALWRWIYPRDDTRRANTRQPRVFPGRQRAAHTRSALGGPVYLAKERARWAAGVGILQLPYVGSICGGYHRLAALKRLALDPYE